MGIMDNMRGDMEKMRARYDELRSRELAGSLDDKGREELSTLRSHFE